MSNRRHFIQGTAALAALGPFAPSAFAQAFEAVKIINGFPAGGTADATRPPHRRQAGRHGLFEERRGGGEQAGRRRPHRLRGGQGREPGRLPLLLTPYSCTAIYPHIYKTLSYDPFKDFVPVSMAAVMTHALAVGPMVAGQREDGEGLPGVVQGQPRQGQLRIARRRLHAALPGRPAGLNNNVDLKHVPYRGSLPAVADMIGGQLASTSTPTGDALANHKAGKVRILATSGALRTPFTPEVATYAEQGFPELTTEEWFGFYAPARTPAMLVANANAAINAALKDKTVMDSLALMGLVAHGSTPPRWTRASATRTRAGARWSRRSASRPSPEEPALRFLIATVALLGAAGCTTMAPLPPRVAVAAQPVLACDALAARFAHPGTRIASTERVASGQLRLPGIPQPMPEHCLVKGSMNERTGVDGKRYAIGFEMRLPTDWNGRFLYQANGGLDGFVTPAYGDILGGGPTSNGLAKGFAVISSDAGHAFDRSTPIGGATFGLDPQARLDYGYNAVEQLTPMAKSLVATYYGKRPDTSYLVGTSNGGRHGFVAASRLPREYDGILVSTPATGCPWPPPRNSGAPSSSPPWRSATRPPAGRTSRRPFRQGP
jgi:tripartite-type tricarboxylate transporter receptor subunit TctC